MTQVLLSVGIKLSFVLHRVATKKQHPNNISRGTIHKPKLQDNICEHDISHEHDHVVNTVSSNRVLQSSPPPPNRQHCSEPALGDGSLITPRPSHGSCVVSYWSEHNTNTQTHTHMQTNTKTHTHTHNTHTPHDVLTLGWAQGEHQQPKRSIPKCYVMDNLGHSRESGIASWRSAVRHSQQCP